MGIFSSVQEARIAKTLLFLSDPKAFVETLASDISALIRKAEREGLTPVIRLNGTSDISWEVYGGEMGVSLMDRFPGVQFYDYTKNPARAMKFARGEMPGNYFLALSRSECNSKAILETLTAGGTVAAVFDTKKGHNLPETWAGKRVVDGDDHDAIFEHGQGVVIGLRAKGAAKKDESGFVIATGKGEA